MPLSDREIAEEVKTISERPWPAGSVLPMKKYGKPGQFPDFGILVKDKLDRVYRINFGEAIEVLHAGGIDIRQHLTEMNPPAGLEGFAHTRLEIEANTSTSGDAVVELLKDVPVDSYDNLTALVKAGWVVD